MTNRQTVENTIKRINDALILLQSDDIHQRRMGRAKLITARGILKASLGETDSESASEARHSFPPDGDE